MKLLSLFSGCGALDLGFKQSGFETVLSTDNSIVACETLNKNKISKEIINSDIRKLNFKKIKFLLT